VIRKYVIQLIPRTYSSTNDTETIVHGTPREVLADRKSIRQSEFYQAVAGGFRPEATFVIWNYEYEGEDQLTYEGDLYEVIRRFPDKDNKQIELVCQRVDDASRNLSPLRDGF
jgi:SPP1 family predicted phage head-tail adaptor